jgi:hypothetical protein
MNRLFHFAATALALLLVSACSDAPTDVDDQDPEVATAQSAMPLGAPQLSPYDDYPGPVRFGIYYPDGGVNGVPSTETLADMGIESRWISGRLDATALKDIDVVFIGRTAMMSLGDIVMPDLLEFIEGGGGVITESNAGIFDSDAWRGIPWSSQLSQVAGVSRPRGANWGTALAEGLLGVEVTDPSHPITAGLPAAFSIGDSHMPDWLNWVWDATKDNSKNPSARTIARVKESGWLETREAPVITADYGEGCSVFFPVAVDSIPFSHHHAWSEIPDYRRLFINAVNWCARNANHTPVADAGPERIDRIANIGGRPAAMVDLSGSGSSDPDGDLLGYVWTWPSDLSPSGYDTATGRFVTVEVPRSVRVLADSSAVVVPTKVALTVDDGRYRGTSTDTIEVLVGNRAPRADAGSNQRVVGTGPTTPVTLDGSRSADADGDPLTYSWTWSGRKATGVAPTVNLPRGTEVITLKVTDGVGGSGTDTVMVTVTNGEATADAGPDQTLPANVAGAPSATVTLNGSGSSDPDGDALTYAWTWAGGSASGVNPTVTLPRGVTTITLEVNDGHGSVDLDWVWVTVLNRAPTADAGPDQTLPASVAGAPSATVTLNGSGSSDPDGDALTYAWTWAGGSASGVSPTVTLPRGVTTITLKVNDGQGGSATDEVTVTVLNRAPAAEAGADQTLEAVGPSTPVSLDGSASSDADGDALTYAWTWAGGSAQGASLTLELPPGVHTFTLTVDDGNGGTDTDEVVVNIVDTTAPTLSFALLATELWPANHKMVTVARGIAASDIVDASVDIAIDVVSNEPDEGLGDGDTAGDIVVVDNGDGTWDIQLRAERSARGAGRIYTITVTATDASGNVTTASGQVKVPLSQGNGKGKEKK